MWGRGRGVPSDTVPLLLTFNSIMIDWLLQFAFTHFVPFPAKCCHGLETHPDSMSVRSVKDIYTKYSTVLLQLLQSLLPLFLIELLLVCVASGVYRPSF